MSGNATEHEALTSLVANYFDIEKIIPGRTRSSFVARYVGRLRMDSEVAHKALTQELKQHKLTPIFLEDKDEQIIQLIPSLPKPKPSNPWINLLFFVLTVASVLYTGFLIAYENPIPESGVFELFLANIGAGIPFTVSILGILLAHEFGHYIAARYHKTAVTLPYFLPLPAYSPFGTLGAFIQLKEPPRNKRVLLDIGLAGPFAGLIFAIPILFYGLSLSQLDQLPSFIQAGDAISLEGNSIFYLFAKYVVHGQWLPSPLSYGGTAPLLYWLKYLFTGLPTPLGGTDVFLHPIAWAGWGGLLVTAFNLLPVGQLDGGHAIYALLGRRAKYFVPFVLVALVILGFFWQGWWLWAVLIYFMGRQHAEPLDQITQLDGKRKALAILAIVIFVLIFTPIPLRGVFGPYGGP
jgi:membrane-associated protease RseP (regulator of RpoE activity)